MGNINITQYSPVPGETPADANKIASTNTVLQTLLNGALDDTNVAAANKDGTAATPSMRTIGTGATQACAGNDARLSIGAPDAGNNGKWLKTASGAFAWTTLALSELSGYPADATKVPKGDGSWGQITGANVAAGTLGNNALGAGIGIDTSKINSAGYRWNTNLAAALTEISARLDLLGG